MDDLTITITKAMIWTGIGGATIYLIKTGTEELRAAWKAKRLADEARLKSFEAHIATCEKKDTHIALIDQAIKTLQHHSRENDEQRQWLGDCVVAIAATLGVRLPERP